MNKSLEPGEIKAYKEMQAKNQSQQPPEQDEESEALLGRDDQQEIEEIKQTKWEILKLNVYMIYISI